MLTSTLLCWTIIPFNHLRDIDTISKHCWTMFRLVPCKCHISLSSPSSTLTEASRTVVPDSVLCPFKMGFAPIGNSCADSFQCLWHRVFDFACLILNFFIMEVSLNEDDGQFTWKWTYIGKMIYSVGSIDFELWSSITEQNWEDQSSICNEVKLVFSGELLLQVIDLASSGMPQIFEKEEKNEADPTPPPLNC